MKEKFLALAQKLGFIDKVKANQMTSSDWETLSNAFQEENGGLSLSDAIAQMQQTSAISEEHQTALTALMTSFDRNGQPVATQTAEAALAANEAPVNLAAGITQLKKDNVVLASQAETEPVRRVIPNAAQRSQAVVLGINGPGTTATHLYGITDDVFAMNRPWNVSASTLSARKENYTKEEKTLLFADFDKYASGVASRYKSLFAAGQIADLMAGNIDYTPLQNDLGDYYRVRRQDAIISFILSRPTVANIWPIRYGVQDEEVVVNVFEGRSYSQSYQSGRVFAGSYKFEPAKAKVKDVMFKYKFSDLKELEKQFIGDLNKEGSNPMKWSFIEYIMVECAKIQQNEVELRRVKGVRVESTPGKAAHFMYASDGWLTTKDRYINENRIMVLEAYKTYTSTTIVDFVRAFVREVFRMRGTGSLEGLALHMNALDGPDFFEGYRNKYGSNNNYTGEKMEVKDFPLPEIVLVPNMGDRQDMWLAPKGAVEIQELVPGEFFGYYFQQDLEELMVVSYKKEGTFAFAGRKFATKAELIASKGRHTNIFFTNPVTTLAAGATTADAFVNELFETVNNAGATAFTDFTNAQEGVAYKLVCSGLTNATSVAKAAKFANITAAYTPTALGHYLKVIYDPATSTYVELERKVGGTVTINTAAKAPEYVESI